MGAGRGKVGAKEEEAGGGVAEDKGDKCVAETAAKKSALQCYCEEWANSVERERTQGGTAWRTNISISRLFLCSLHGRSMKHCPIDMSAWRRKSHLKLNLLRFFLSFQFSDFRPCGRMR